MEPLESLRRLAWDLYEEDPDLDIARLVAEAIDRGVPVDHGMLRSVCRLAGARLQSLFPPARIVEFMCLLLRGEGLGRVFDPWANFGELVGRVRRECRFARGTGVVMDAGMCRAADLLNHDRQVQFLQADPLVLLDALVFIHYDAIVCCPPLEPDPLDLTIDGSGIARHVVDRLAHVLLLESVNHLTESGVCLFLVASDFFRRDSQAARSHLDSFGFRVNAAIEVEARLLPGFGQDGFLVVVSENRTEGLLVSRLGAGDCASEVAAAILAHAHGEDPGLGRLADPDEFYLPG